MSLSAKEKLFQNILLHYTRDKGGFTALDCVDFMPVNRSVISHYLNRLCDDGKLIKDNARPVRFYVDTAQSSDKQAPVNKKRQDTFSCLIGVDGSLACAVSLCRSAVDYPTNGLPVLLTGESGVGKSYLASLIYNYALERGRIAADKPLIELNCADYANNPELLSGTLFGYTKGAFTGADREKRGALDDADGGILFLDEVHRLSAENQEKLFLFMDKGYFYRLGDNRTRHPATIRFIFATTENIDTVLLNTFRRRIPVRVNLPNFISRPLTERVAQVEHFLSSEAQSLARDIHWDVSLMHQLVMSPVRGNIGELKNQIKVMCASAWSDSDNPKFITLTTPYLHASSGEMLVISHRGSSAPLNANTLLPKAMRDDVIFKEFCHSGNTLLLNRKLEQHLADISGVLHRESLYSGYVWQNTLHAISELESLTGLEFNQEHRKAIWLCLNYAIHHANDDVQTAELQAITDYVSSKACLLAQECISLLRKHVTNDPFALLLPLLSSAFNKLAGEDDLIQGVIVSHGRATASSIASIANQLIGGYLFKAFDMANSTSTRDMIDMLISHLHVIKQSAGLIILVDMGSLKTIYEEIKLHLHGELLVINNVSTAMALDIASKIQSHLSMAEIIESAKGAYEVETRYYAGVLPGSKIIISCISGEGISRKLKDIVQRYLAREEIDIVTMEYDDVKWKIAHADPALNGTRLIITTTDLDAGYIPLLGVEQLIKEKTAVLRRDYFADLLTPDGLEPMIDEVVKLFTVEGVASRLNFLNPVVIIDEVESVIKQYESYYRIHFESYLRINLFMHVALMMERVIVNAGMHNRDDAALTPEQQTFVAVHDTFFDALNRKYHTLLPLTEVLMIYEIMEPWIILQPEN
ncbi:sigma 54-interacting transcriptional regulator [Yersinia intermedia]|uniref:sigma 54-interacting transcriptional regulator n=1 Tax=Yersinia intermedia TaxID=631 RepID=UPI000B7601F0|nr:sigma 54-interacting transcriptional regulator [Yersinia intermedia]MCW8114164.1 sigma 54-interacting transcriptional regulator [Yersinia intermedia]MDA5518944.1 sigma 54-interacting transcriptional regulator [Yersinia intermedia]OWF86797.1 PTS sugar transporter subunit IIA [Yersinia intermedia]